MGLAPIAFASTAGAPLSRSEMIDRAKYGVAHPPAGGYDQANTTGLRDSDNRGYRCDCSGYVSLAWHLTSSLTTYTLPGVSNAIAKSQLLAGDIMLSVTANSNGYHVVLFEAWVDNSTKSSYWGYEFGGGSGPVYHQIPYPYFPDGRSFAPYRYQSVIDTPGSTDPANTDLEEDDMIRLMHLPDGRYVVVNHGDYSYWWVRDASQLTWLRNQSIKELTGDQPANLLAGYKLLAAS